jgi:hypothetical protein
MYTSRHAAMAVLVLSLAVTGVAQEFRGTILGRITDPTGSVVPAASITITNQDTQAKYAAASNANGNYSIPFVTPGTYSVSVAVPGFKAVVRPGILVRINDRIALDFALEVGQTSEKITVNAESPVLETNNAEMGQVVDAAQIEHLPMDSDNPMNLVAMAGGVIAGSGDQLSNTQNWISMNGGSGTLGGNDISVDGVSNSNPRAGGMAVTAPSMDAVQEFKVVTTLFDASEGRSNGGSISFTTKGGTNSLHGTGFGYLGNADFNANGWQRNSLGLPRLPAGFERWGGTFGGPVYFPQWMGPARYNGKDKTFFFVSFEQIGPNQSSTLVYGHVPTALERQGNFSQTLAAVGSGIVAIDNPFTRTRGTNNAVVSVPFPNSTIPTSLINSTGGAVMNLYPLPNMSGQSRISTFNWDGTNTMETTLQNVSTRIDQNFSERNKAFFRFSRVGNGTEFVNPALPGAYQINTAPGSTTNPQVSTIHNLSGSIDDTLIITPAIVASFRMGYARTDLNATQGQQLSPTAMDLPQVVLANQVAPSYAQMIMAENIPSFGSSTRTSTNDTYSYFATITQLHGKHSFKYGADIRVVRWNENNPGTAQVGRFSFTSAITSSDPTNSSTTNTSGSGMASLLLGTASAGSIGYNTPISVQNYYFSGFFQDDIKVTSKLTVNLGIRYELETPPTERYNRITWGFDPTVPLPVTVPGYNLQGGIVFADTNGKGRESGTIDGNNFGPRFGFAYAAAPKWVIRGGYGIFYADLLDNIAGWNQVTTTGLGSQSTYNNVTTMTTSNDGGLTPATTISNPFPNGLSTPTGNSLGVMTGVGGSISVLSPHRLNPYVEQWQFSVQRQIGGVGVASLAYAGSHALKMVSNLLNQTGTYYNLNELPDQYLVAGLPANNKVTNPFYKIFPASTTLGGSSTTTQGQLWVRYPQFTTVNLYGNNTNNDLYHSLQARFEKRISHGLSLVANYTYSRNMFYDMTSLVNVRKYRTVASTDYPNLATVFAVYDLPFGRGREIGANLNRWANGVVGGWTLAGSFSGRSGDPLSVTQALGRPSAETDPVYHTSIESRLGNHLNPATGQPTNPFFNTSVWLPLPNNYTITKEPPLLDWLRGPAQVYKNISIFKTFNIRENVRLELRGLLNNFTNSPVFGDPATNMSNPASFGVITTAGGTRTVNFMAKLRF